MQRERLVYWTTSELDEIEEILSETFYVDIMRQQCEMNSMSLSNLGSLESLEENLAADLFFGIGGMIPVIGTFISIPGLAYYYHQWQKSGDPIDALFVVLTALALVPAVGTVTKGAMGIIQMITRAGSGMAKGVKGASDVGRTVKIAGVTPETGSRLINFIRNSPKVKDVLGTGGVVDDAVRVSTQTLTSPAAVKAGISAGHAAEISGQAAKGWRSLLTIVSDISKGAVHPTRVARGYAAGSAAKSSWVAINSIKIQNAAIKTLNKSIAGSRVAGTDFKILYVAVQPGIGPVAVIQSPTLGKSMRVLDDISPAGLNSIFGKSITSTEAFQMAVHPSIGNFLLSNKFARWLKVRSGGTLSAVAVLRSFSDDYGTGLDLSTLPDDGQTSGLGGLEFETEGMSEEGELSSLIALLKGAIEED